MDELITELVFKWTEGRHEEVAETVSKMDRASLIELALALRTVNPFAPAALAGLLRERVDPL